MKIWKSFFPVVLSGLLLFSCSDFEPDMNNQIALEAQVKNSGLDLNDPGLLFTAALSQKLNEEAVRKFVSENIQEQFDGDLNFLYYTSKDKSLGGTNSKALTFQEVSINNYSMV